MDAIGLQGVTLSKVTLPKMALDGYRESDMDYIRDGLVFHLDGINKGGVTGKWTDLVGGVEFTPDDDTTIFGDDFVNGDLTSDKMMKVLATKGTIEIAFESTVSTKRNSLYFSTGYQSGLAAGMANDKSWIFSNQGINKTSTITNMSTPNAHIVSSNNNMTLYDGVVLPVENKDYWYIRKDTAIVLRGNHNSNIHSIRIYDRILTEDEMRHNQRMDIKRFGLKIQPPVMTLQEDWEGEYVPSGEGV